MKYLFLALYLLDAALHLYACTPPEKHPLRRVTKCLLMPLLLGWYYYTAANPSAVIMLALLFGFLGDVFLLLPERSWLFVSGLIAFAIGHICYTVALLQRIGPPPPLALSIPACAAYVAGMVFMLRTLWPRLPKSMFLPCLIYMGIISFMSLCTLTLLYQQRTAAAIAAFVGSLLFLASDSILSVVTFKRRIPYRYVVVMSTYILAQTLLTASFAVMGGR